MTNILTSTILTNFLYPLLLIFFLSFAVLSKTKLFGDNTQQLNAFISLFVALLFVGVVFPVIIVQNLVYYMTIALVVIFISLFLWGFINGDAKNGFTVIDSEGKKIHKIFAFLIFGSIIFAILWATGSGHAVTIFLINLFSKIFYSSGSASFWTNFVILGIIGLFIAVVLGFNPFKTGSPWIKLGK